jgi:DNA-binding transcriptional MocR family regulator
VCLAQDVSDEFVRLSFSNAPPADIEQGIARLARAVRDVAGRQRADAATFHSTRPMV